jgi:hypothetical protein
LLLLLGLRLLLLQCLGRLRLCLHLCSPQMRIKHSAKLGRLAGAATEYHQNRHLKDPLLGSCTGAVVADVCCVYYSAVRTCHSTDQLALLYAVHSCCLTQLPV